MEDRIQISRLGERFSSHTQARPNRPIRDTEALRERLIAATVETLAEGSDPRLR